MRRVPSCKCRRPTIATTAARPAGGRLQPLGAAGPHGDCGHRGPGRLDLEPAQRRRRGRRAHPPRPRLRERRLRRQPPYGAAEPDHHPRPPPSFTSDLRPADLGLGATQQEEATGPGWREKMSGALRRTPSPQQLFGSAGKTVAAGVAAAGAAVGSALASIVRTTRTPMPTTRPGLRRPIPRTGRPARRNPRARSARW